jgi:uncharacterized Ntn-hydrolase superfamily protein
MMRRLLSHGRKAILVVALVMASTASATWSIVITDSSTKEVAIGTVTCLNNYDLLAIVPVVVVGKGAGACQASGDFDGIRRPIIFEQLQLGTPPDQILAMLAGITGHQSRQYGIADTQGRMITFTGTQCLQWAGGVVGQQGTMVYAIQGNILAGNCVVPAIEQAVLNTPGDIPAKLMAGMQAARQKGGDGRCSCSSSNPTSCGCPPPSFRKAGHIGGMVVARIGDTDDTVCNASGCADGDYFMRLNVAFQPTANPDPVQQLQELFDTWRAGLVGRPDAIQSTASFAPATLPPNGLATGVLLVTVNDWQGQRVLSGIQSVTVAHAPDSANISTIGAVTNNGDGTFSVALTAGTQTGVDRFTVTIDDGIRPVILMPEPSLRYFALGDLNCNGSVEFGDINPFVLALADPSGYATAYPNCNVLNGDINTDGATDFADINPFVGLLVDRG